MKVKIYSIYDSKAKVWLQPQFLMNKGTAHRAFDATCNDKNSQFYKYAEDFTMFEIGDFDDETCEIKMYEAKESMGTALEFKKE